MRSCRRSTCCFCTYTYGLYLHYTRRLYGTKPQDIISVPNKQSLGNEGGKGGIDVEAPCSWSITVNTALLGRGFNVGFCGVSKARGSIFWYVLRGVSVYLGFISLGFRVKAAVEGGWSLALCKQRQPQLFFWCTVAESICGESPAIFTALGRWEREEMKLRDLAAVMEWIHWFNVIGWIKDERKVVLTSQQIVEEIVGSKCLVID